MYVIEDRQPWKSVVRECVIDSDQVGVLLNEALLLPQQSGARSVDLATQIDETTSPELYRFIELYIKIEVLKYIKDIYDAIPIGLDYNAWVRTSTDGSGLLIHDHSGAHVTCIVYLEGSEGDLILHDPRGSAGRAYPMSIREQNFKPMVIDAKPGRVLIFPSYLFHYVDKHHPSLRTVLTTDFFIKDV